MQTRELAVTEGKGSNLCSKCRELDLYDLFRTDNRTPEPDARFLRETNSLDNISTQNLCPFCCLLSYILSSSPRTVKKERDSYNDPNEIYIEPQRTDYALCGIEVKRDLEALTASCLHVETGKYSFQHKIVLSPDDARQIPTRPLYILVRQLGSSVDFTVLRGWLDECSLSHGQTCNPEPVELADEEFERTQRAIDVVERTVVHVDLRATRYAALTYVWGNPSAWAANGRYSQSTEGKESTNTLSEGLPRTFEDAFQVCLQLQIPYLWIDYLCIDQWNENDKRTQIRHMDFIYDTAYVTLVAAEGTDPTAGLSRVSVDAQMEAAGNQQYTVKVGSQQLVVIHGFAVPRWAWNTRAWTLQESLLSRRLLVFNSYGVSLYCRTSVWREDVMHMNHDFSISGWQAIPRSVFTNEYFRTEFSISRYAQLTALCGPRSLSDPMDSLNVICGILNVWARNSRLDFLSGHPSKYLSDTLVWFGSKYHLRGGLFPTWSWASYQGEMKYPLIISECSERLVSSFQKRHKFNLDNFKGSLHSRLVRFADPDSINVGTVIEQEGLVSHIKGGPSLLNITSYIARFRLPVMTREAYKFWSEQFDHYNETVHDDQGRPQNSMALIDEEHQISVRSSPLGYAGVCMDLPQDISARDESQLRTGESEFLMLKYWNHMSARGNWNRHRWRVWALLISRDVGVNRRNAVRRLGCTMIPAEVWELGSPRLETVLLA